MICGSVNVVPMPSVRLQWLEVPSSAEHHCPTMGEGMGSQFVLLSPNLPISQPPPPQVHYLQLPPPLLPTCGATWDLGGKGIGVWNICKSTNFLET